MNDLSNIALPLQAFDWDAIILAPAQDSADALTALLGSLDTLEKRSFAMKGLILLMVEDRELWKLRTDPTTEQPFSSMNQWIIRSAPWSHGSCHDALRSVKELRELPFEDLLALPRCNMEVLRGISSEVRKRPEVIAAAQSMSNREFLKEIESKHPEQHVESRQAIHLSPVKSAKTVIDLGIQMGIVLEDVKTREDVLEIWAIDYVEANKEAYARVMKERA